MLDELRYEWRRLQTFVEWPLERPRPAELAKVYTLGERERES